MSSSLLQEGANFVLVEAAEKPQGTGDLQDWSIVRDQFNLSRDCIQLSTFYISSHPRPVGEAIDQYRRALDENPFRVVEQGMFDPETEHIPAKVKAEVAACLGGKPEENALTGSTTMGPALVYNGLRIKPGQEILTTSARQPWRARSDIRDIPD